MTRTDYPWGMSGTQSDPHYINTKALEGFMRSFDHVVSANYLHGERHKIDPAGAVKKLMVCKARGQRPRQHRASFWHTFPPLKAIRRFRDSIRLRKYNRDWIRNNIH